MQHLDVPQERNELGERRRWEVVSGQVDLVHLEQPRIDLRKELLHFEEEGAAHAHLR